MEGFIKIGRIFYGLAITGIGLQQLQYGEFRPVLLPGWPSWLPGMTVCAYLAGVALTGTGLAICLDRKTRSVTLALGGVFLGLFYCVHIPHEIIADPLTRHLGVWTNAFKVLALSGGAFVLAGVSLIQQKDIVPRYSLLPVLEKVIPFGRFFLSITMITFGIEHFLYTQTAATLVPHWIPDPVFWTCLTGVALISAGVAIMLNIRMKVVALLLGTMIFLWVLILHLPRAISFPSMNKGNEITSLFEALAFSGTAFMIAGRLFFYADLKPPLAACPQPGEVPTVLGPTEG